jgi:hypothetical protein
VETLSPLDNILELCVIIEILKIFKFCNVHFCIVKIKIWRPREICFTVSSVGYDPREKHHEHTNVYVINMAIMRISHKFHVLEFTVM